MTLDIEKIKAAALDVFAPSVPNATVIELITRLEAAEKDAAKYQELIYAVGRKFHDETRHETAMKYIRQMEEPSKNAAMKGAA